jgi:hypothetical protein
LPFANVSLKPNPTEPTSNAISRSPITISATFRALAILEAKKKDGRLLPTDEPWLAELLDLVQNALGKNPSKTPGNYSKTLENSPPKPPPTPNIRLLSQPSNPPGISR